MNKLDISNRIIQLNGSSYEMGYQHGLLLKNEIKENIRAMLKLCENNGYNFDTILSVWNVMKNYLPKEYIDEIKGLSNGSGIEFDEIAVFNTIPAIFNIMYSCCGASIWGSATIDGKLIHLRSFDWNINIIDSISDKYIQENLYIFIRNPSNRYSSISPGFAGCVFSWDGINEKGISISETTVLTNDQSYNGISAAFRMRMVLDYANTIDDAIEIMNNNKTCGWNFIISDANIPSGVVIEQTLSFSYIGSWDNPNESIDPFWKIENVVRRTPCFISPLCASVELNRICYDPTTCSSLLNYILGKNNLFGIWTHYRVLSQDIEKNYGKIDLNLSIIILRDEYSGNTDFIMNIINNILGGYQPLYQWASNPKTGEIVISFADRNHYAYETPIYYLNFFNYIN
jgi:acyl-CoA:6-aminopenicillanic acid acyl transferase